MTQPAWLWVRVRDPAGGAWLQGECGSLPWVTEPTKTVSNFLSTTAASTKGRGLTRESHGLAFVLRCGGSDAHSVPGAS